MIARLTTYVVALVAVGLTVLALAYGGGIPYDDQKEALDALFTVAAIVFGVLGAWVAVLHPGGLGKAFELGAVSCSELRAVARLFRPLRVATAIVAGALLVRVIAPLASEIEILVEMRRVARAVLFALIVSSSIALVWTLLVSLAPLEDTDALAKKNEEIPKRLKARRGRAQVRRREEGVGREESESS